MQTIAVHNHFNLRRLCDIAIDDASHAKLLKPPPLKPRYVMVRHLDAEGRVLTRRENHPLPEAHVVELMTGRGLLRLFRVKGNGVDYFVTNTPKTALAIAA